MAYNLLRCERDQSYLMPPSMRDWLSEGHLAWFIVDAVGQMDLREFYAAYRSDGWGAAAYDPEMMVAILLYAYCLGLRSSRRIARALEEDVGFRVVAANQQPDFRTICRFRAEQEEALEELFVEVLRLCHEAGLVKLGVVALDGTKVAADAALATNRSHQAIEEEVQRMLAEAKAADAEEDAHYGPDRRGDELPEGLGGRRERLKRLKEAKERLQREAEAAAKAVQEHVEQRRAEEEATGKKKRGRKPKVVEPLPTEEAKANTTDPDSRIMKTRQGYVQGYNAQAVVNPRHRHGNRDCNGGQPPAPRRRRSGQPGWCGQRRASASLGGRHIQPSYFEPPPDIANAGADRHGRRFRHGGRYRPCRRVRASHPQGRAPGDAPKGLRYRQTEPRCLPIVVVSNAAVDLNWTNPGYSAPSAKRNLAWSFSRFW